MKSKKVGLFFGSFNPLHIGHMILANYMVEYTDIKELWFVVSPQNPLKNKKTLLDEIHRYAIVERAIEDDDRFRVSNIEFSLPKPSYTIDTLTYLEEKYPKNEFVLLLGQDNLTNFHKWKNADVILEKYSLYVYPRDESKIDEFWLKKTNVKIVNAPSIQISATFIRNSIQEGKVINWYLPPKAWQYIQEMNFYKKS